MVKIPPPQGARLYRPPERSQVPEEATRPAIYTPFPLVKETTPAAHADMLTTCYYKRKELKKEAEKRWKREREKIGRIAAEQFVKGNVE